MVLNGAEGMEDMLGKAMTMGGAGLGLAQKLMTSIRADKPATTDAPALPSGTVTIPVTGNGKATPVKV